MKAWKILGLMVVISSLVVWVACSSGSTDTTPTNTTVAVEDLSDLPTLDFDTVDIASASYSALPKSVADGTSTLGGTSTAGCYSINFMKPTALAQLKQAELSKCYVEKTQDYDSSLTVPTGSYGYYLIDQGSGSEGPQYIAVRLGNFEADSSTSFKMEACESTDGSTYTKVMELDVTGDTEAKTWSGNATSHRTFDTPVTTGAGTLSAVFDNSTFTVTMNSAEAISDVFSFDNVASLTTTSTFGRNPDPSDSDATSATTYDDGFQVTFAYDSESSITGGALNTVVGTFGDGAGTVSGICKAYFNDTQGSAKMVYTNSASSSFDFDSSEAFTVTTSGGTTSTAVVDETSATYSTIYDVIAAEDLSSQTLTVPDDVNTAVAWDLGWDCTAPEDSSFTTISVSDQTIYADCQALSEEISTDMGSDSSDCFSESGSMDLSGTYDLSGSCSGLTGIEATIGSTGETSYSTTFVNGESTTLIVSFDYDGTNCTLNSLTAGGIDSTSGETACMVDSGVVDVINVDGPGGACDMIFTPQG